MENSPQHLAELIGGPQDGDILRLHGTQVHNRLVYPVRSSPPVSYVAQFVEPPHASKWAYHEYGLVYHQDGVARYEYRGVVS